MVISSGPKSLPTIGFLTVVRDAEDALFGGYLLLNAVGRPLEFHCTAPVRPNRAQQILYGPSLEPYLCGDRIGQTLFNAAKRTPTLAITDALPVMAARDLVAHPLALLLGRQPASGPEPPGDEAAAAGQWQRVDGPHGGATIATDRLERFGLADYQLAVVAGHSADRQVWAQQWQAFADQLDLEEPFRRIREAIEEARRGVH